MEVADNIRIASDANADSFCDDELKVFDNVKAVMLEKTRIPCTGCGYCMPCPYGVDIPACFSYYNDKYLMEDKSVRFKYLQNMGALAIKPSNASQCKSCGICEIHCPQKIAIRDRLKVVSRELEGIFYKPIVGFARIIMKIK